MHEFDQSLALKIQRGDKDAEQSFINHFAGRIRTVCRYRLLGKKDDQEDAIQETFITALNLIRKGEYDASRGSLARWIGGIAERKCLHIKGRLRQDVALDRNEASFDGESHILEVIDIRRCFENLSQIHRQVLLLVICNGNSYEEAGKLENVPPETVGTRLLTARRLMRECIEPSLKNKGLN